MVLTAGGLVIVDRLGEASSKEVAQGVINFLTDLESKRNYKVSLQLIGKLHRVIFQVGFVYCVVN